MEDINVNQLSNFIGKFLIDVPKIKWIKMMMLMMMIHQHIWQKRRNM